MDRDIPYETNSLIDIRDVRANPGLRWNRAWLSQNRNITLNDVDHLIMHKAYAGWCWYYLSQYIDIQEIRDNPDREWDVTGLVRNKDITLNDVYNMIPEDQIDWSKLSIFININEVRLHPYEPWSKNGLSYNNTITMYDVEHLYLPNATGDWDWRILSRYISMEEIRMYPDKPWNLSFLSFNIDLTISDIDSGIYQPHGFNKFYMKTISQFIDLKQVRLYPHREWDKEKLSHNSSLTVGDVIHLKLPNSTGKWNSFNIAEFMDAQQIRQYPNSVFIDEISRNKGVTIDDILYMDIQ